MNEDEEEKFYVCDKMKDFLMHKMMKYFVVHDEMMDEMMCMIR
jgi:hypothetical protein